MGKLANRLIAVGLTGSLVAGGVFIATHEGHVPGTYVDPAGIITACYGHTSPELKLGTELSEDECLELLAKDLSSHNAQLMRAVQVDLSEGEHVAYLSFHYNVGAGNFRQSTLLRYLNAEQRVEACNQLTRWVYAGGQQLPGLVRRREEEKQICLEGVHHAANQTHTDYHERYSDDCYCGGVQLRQPKTHQ
ncbi:lysozyme [Aliidiomarina maris]|uniref:Lysozyme n=1 Tax=Aliidiomarina maris TaxID=531312 RepID=A0A327X3T2_9GAMM|nr:lysozyme [Aliidiomarina maris]RAK01617.1 lysozyme [Aliidiomarina maris]RUO28443.1 glycosyl hydrolase [Aliidiomarina maris]